MMAQMGKGLKLIEIKHGFRPCTSDCTMYIIVMIIIITILRFLYNAKLIIFLVFNCERRLMKNINKPKSNHLHEIHIRLR